MKSSTWIRKCSLRTSDEKKLFVDIVSPKRTLFEVISSWAPIAISVMALATTVFAQLQAIRHNRLSVMPHVGFLQEDNFAATNVGLFIENNGLGPARIGRLNVYFDGSLISPRNMDAIFEKTRPIFGERSPQWYTTEYTFNLKSGERIGVFFSPPSNVKNVNDFQKLIDKRIFVIGEACSLYDECSYFCSSVSDEKCLEEEGKIGGREGMPSNKKAGLPSWSLYS